MALLEMTHWFTDGQSIPGPLLEMKLDTVLHVERIAISGKRGHAVYNMWVRRGIRIFWLQVGIVCEDDVF